MRSFRLRLCRLIWRLILLALLLNPHSLAAQRLHPQIEELSEEFSNEPLSEQELRLIRCPENIGDIEPARSVAQVIHNKFYRWKEYDVIDDQGRANLCIVLVNPALGAISAEEANILLNASQMWMQSLPSPEDMGVLPPSDPSLQLPAAPLPKRRYFKKPTSSIDKGASKNVDTPISSDSQQESLENSLEPQPEQIIGTDERERVSDTQVYPWNTICYVSLKRGSSSYRGTAFLVSPYVVLTAGHNIYDQDDLLWSSDFLIAPGQYQYFEGGEVYRPYGTRTANDLKTNTIYTQGGGYEYDYGAAMFDTPFNSISTFMPVEFDYMPTYINVAGFPREVQNESNSSAMWRSSSYVAGVYGDNDRILMYTADTSGGDSGGPVWVYSGSTGLRRVIAIHNFGSSTENGAARMVSQNEDLITEWMQWNLSPLGWQNIPGKLNHLTSGDLNADGKSDLAGTTVGGQMFFNLNLNDWQWMPGILSQLASGDLNADGRADLLGLTGAGQIFFTFDLANWQWMPGVLDKAAIGDLNGDGRDDLIGLTLTGNIYYTFDLYTWHWMPGILGQICTGDLNSDGKDDLIGVTTSGQVFYTADLYNWSWIPGTLSQVTAGDFNGDGKNDLAGLSASGQLFYTTNLNDWQGVSMTFKQIVAGDLNGDGRSDLAGVDASGQIYYTLDSCSDW